MLQPILRIAVAGSARAFSTASSATLSLAGVSQQETWGRLPTGIPEDVTQQRLGPLADDDQPPFRRMRMRRRKRIEFESQGDAQAFLGEERNKLQKLIDQKHDQKHPERQQKKAEELGCNSSQEILKSTTSPLPAPSALPNSAPDGAVDSNLHQVNHPQPEEMSSVKELGKPSKTKPFDEVAIEHIRNVTRLTYVNYAIFTDIRRRRNSSTKFIRNTHSRRRLSEVSLSRKRSFKREPGQSMRNLASETLSELKKRVQRRSRECGIWYMIVYSSLRKSITSTCLRYAPVRITIR